MTEKDSEAAPSTPANPAAQAAQAAQAAHPTGSGTYAADLALALHLADLADALTTARFGAADLNITAKPDLTPVSDADLAVETELRAELTRSRPADAVLGEEFGGDTAARPGRQWVIDPIDSTKNFVRGVPVWATLIALVVDGTPVVGVVSAPGLGSRWWAADGAGAWGTRGGSAPRRLSVSSVERLGDASLSYSSLTGWQERGIRAEFINLTDALWRTRAYGDFLSYCYVAEGGVDIAAEPEVSLWDLAPLDILVREAGGRFTSLEGQAGPHGGSAVASNGLIHEAALNLLGH